MLLQEVLFDSDDQVNDNNRSINQTNSKSLVIIFERIELAAGNLIRHSELP